MPTKKTKPAKAAKPKAPVKKKAKVGRKPLPDDQKSKAFSARLKPETIVKLNGNRHHHKKSQAHYIEMLVDEDRARLLRKGIDFTEYDHPDYGKGED